MNVNVDNDKLLVHVHTVCAERGLLNCRPWSVSTVYIRGGTVPRADYRVHMYSRRSGDFVSTVRPHRL
jgi:hypothetical protein